MPYEVRKNGRNYDVVATETDEVLATHKPPEAKKKADAQVQSLKQQKGSENPDKVVHRDGVKYNITYQNKESYDGANQ